MRRASITIPDGLGSALERCRRDLDVSPSLASVVQVALERYLEERGYPVETAEGLEENEQEIIPQLVRSPEVSLTRRGPGAGEPRSPTR